ncbi:beta-tubulin [Methylorubrum populi]|uniref:Beta-tubulin n=1 Tax=Methylobacterium radiotolerans TaxID=31998 RepID=A0ABU7T6S9_9HYPH
MRIIPPALAARLEGGATTLCRCWALRRPDGLVLGFTDHDRDLTFSGVTYGARSGLEAAEASAELGFAVSGGEVAGALTSAGITGADVAAGLYDGAGIETWLVDWREPSSRILLDVASLGEIRQSGSAFVAELRGLMHRLDAQTGRSFRAACDAQVGDSRCRVSLADPRYHAAGTVGAALESGRLAVALAGDFAAGWFSGGRLAWEGGANAGHAADLRTHLHGGGGTILELWEPPPRPAMAGDAFRLTAGCDKRLATCRDKFANALNFQGFPHMPGNDFVLRAAPDAGARPDGSSLFR